MKNRRKNPVNTRKVEIDYARQLTKVARHVADVIRTMTEGLPIEEIPSVLINNMMNEYANSLIPWATKTAVNMITATGIQDEKAWHEYAKEMSNELKREIRNTKTDFVQALALEQVQLIRSIPREAALRVNELCIKGIEDGTRSTEMIAEIMRTGEVTYNRAKLIARTETARTASTFTQVRAEQLGVTHYVWTTSHDSDVRRDHARLDGRVIAFNDPPSHADGHTYHAGEIWNCRCWKKLILPG